MKKVYKYLFLIIAFPSCTDDFDDSLSDNDSNNTNNTTQGAAVVYDLEKVPKITLEFKLADWNKLLLNYDLNSKNEKKVVSKFSYEINSETIILDSIGLKLRGNTSRRRPEGANGELHNPNNPDWHHCHFGLDFSKYKPTQKFKGLNKMVLKWFKDDAAYTREIYCYNLFRKYNVWTAPRASYCRINIKVDGDNLPANYGVYAMIESVDEDYIADRSSQWGNSVGFLWKCGWAGWNNANFVSTQSIGIENVTLNPATSVYYAYDLKTRDLELGTGSAELISFINDLNTKTGTEFKNWISQKMDIDLFLKTYAVNVLVGMWDDYWVNANNFYFYFAPNGKAYFIPYDYDNTLGTSLLMANSGTQNPLNWGTNSGERPLISKILAIPEFQTKYKYYITELTSSQNDLFYTTHSINRINAWQAIIAPYIYNDTGEDMILNDVPASWGNCSFYRLLSGNNQGGNNGDANYFSSRILSIPF